MSGPSNGGPPNTSSNTGYIVKAFECASCPAIWTERRYSCHPDRQDWSYCAKCAAGRWNAEQLGVLYHAAGRG